MKNNLENSEALKRVWRWKEKICNEVKNKKLNEKLKEIHKLAENIKKKVTDKVAK